MQNQLAAERYLSFLQNYPSPRDYKVNGLYLGRSINVDTAALILLSCRRLTSLTIRFTYRHIACAVRNPLYRPLLELTDLKYLYIGLTVLHTSRMVSVTICPLRACLGSMTTFLFMRLRLLTRLMLLPMFTYNQVLVQHLRFPLFYLCDADTLPPHLSLNDLFCLFPFLVLFPLPAHSLLVRARWCSL